jgi:hypothetical protein
MRRILFAAFLAVSALGAASAGEPRNEYVSDTAGVYIAAPAARTDAPFYQIVSMFLPPSDGFAANVIIQRHKSKLSIKEFFKQTTDSFENTGLTIIKSELKDNAVTYEYKGAVNGKGGGRTFHFYAKAIKKGEYLFLATAVALESHWEEQKGELMKSVDSFTLKEK